jgi:uncharacterized repeat protein (TIGR01451 family)
MKARIIGMTAAAFAAAFNGMVYAASPAPGAMQRLQILHHERLPSLDAPAKARSAQPALQAQENANGQAVSMAFTAFEKSFNLVLEPNHRLLDALPSAQKHRLKAQMRLYRGHVAGVEGSWVRLTRTAGKFSGMIWDGREAYLIDPFDEVASALPMTAKPSVPQTVIYRLSDVIWYDARCALDPHAAPVTHYQSLVQELQAQALPAAARQLSLAIVADTQFVQSNSTDPEAAVVARMNVVDGIYSERVGVHLHIAEIRSLQSNGTLTATSPSTLLSQFVSYTNSAGFNNPGLAHLLTGRDLDGSVVGIAYLSAICSTRYGVGLTEAIRTGTIGALITAHEIGHNFGAPHDNQSGSACASTGGGYLMNPVLNGSDQFSACSLQQMQPVIDRASCIAAIPDAPTADIRAALPVNPINATVGQTFAYRVEVNNGGTGLAMNAGATIALPSALAVQDATTDVGTCAIGAGEVSCGFGDLVAGATRIITMNVVGNAVGQFVSTVTVSADNDSNTGNNSLQAAINVGSADTGSTIFEAHFDAGKDGFSYIDDAFRGTTQPAYASGSRSATQGFSGGGLVVRLGGIDNHAISNISGGWSRSFTLPAPRRAVLMFRYRLNQTPHYESDEVSQALLSVDGRLISTVATQDFLAQIRGNGNGGANIGTGWRSVNVDLGVLAAGAHTVVIGGFNNKKTHSDEQSRVFIDDVVLTGQ